MYAGLHTGSLPSSGNEFDAAGYGALELPPARFTVASEMAMLNMTVEWEDAAAGTWGDPTQMGFWNHETQRSSSRLLAYMDLAQDVDEIVLGTRVYAQSGDIVFRIPLVGITAAGAALCYNGGLVSSTIYLGLHTGATPSASNELSGTGYSALEIVAGEWDVANNAASLNAEQEWAGAARSELGRSGLCGVLEPSHQPWRRAICSVRGCWRRTWPRS